jgi:hypothetical protein
MLDRPAIDCVRADKNRDERTSDARAPDTVYAAVHAASSSTAGGRVHAPQC